MTGTTLPDRDQSWRTAFHYVVRRWLWTLAGAVALYGGIDGVLTFPLADSAPQQAAIAAVMCAYAVVPYVVARAFDEATRPH